MWVSCTHTWNKSALGNVWDQCQSSPYSFLKIKKSLNLTKLWIFLLHQHKAILHITMTSSIDSSPECGSLSNLPCTLLRPGVVLRLLDRQRVNCQKCQYYFLLITFLTLPQTVQTFYFLCYPSTPQCNLCFVIQWEEFCRSNVVNEALTECALFKKKKKREKKKRLSSRGACCAVCGHQAHFRQHATGVAIGLPQDQSPLSLKPIRN